MEEIEHWISNRGDGSWTFFFEKCKMFRINWECKQADVYIALKCYRSKDSTNEDTNMKELYKCPFKIVVAGKLTNEPVYTFTKRHNHDVDHEIYYQERFKAALLAAIARDRTSSFEALYRMVQIETGTARKWLVPVTKLKKAIRRKKSKATPRTSTMSVAPNIPLRRFSSVNTEVESDLDDSSEAVEEVPAVGFEMQMDDSSEVVEEVVEDGIGMQQQPFIDVDTNKDGDMDPEPDEAGAEEGSVGNDEEQLPHGCDQEDIPQPKVSQDLEPREKKDRPVCRVAPMRRIQKQLRLIVLDDSD